MATKGSFFADTLTDYIEDSPASPADAAIAPNEGPAKSSFYGGSGSAYASVETIQATYDNMVAEANAAAASAASAASHDDSAAAHDTSAAAHDASAATHDTNAANSASAAAASESSAAAHDSSAATHDTNAANSASAANTSAQNAAASESSAASHDASSATHDTNAANSATLAQQWATQTASEVVAGQGYGAKKYAQDAAQSATDAQTAANNAATTADNEIAARAVRYDVAQTLTTAQQSQARTNIGAASPSDIPTGVVRYDIAQTLTTAEQTQARTNIGAGTGTGGGPTSARMFATLADAQAYNPGTDPAPDVIWLGGYLNAGDIGCRYVQTAADPGNSAGFQIASGQWYKFDDDVVNVRAFGAVGDGTSDDTLSFTHAFAYAMAISKPVYAPKGRYKLTSNVAYTTSAGTSFTTGLRFFGDGQGITVIVNAVASNAAISVDTSALLNFQLGGWLKGFSIEADASAPVSSIGISLRKAYNFTLYDIHVTGLSSSGIQFVCTTGDQDACNNVLLEQVRVENCSLWGIWVDIASGYNEVSYLTMLNCFIQQCGIEGTQGGGMYWRGQCLTMIQTAFTINNNRALYIEGGAGLGSNVSGDNLTFENNRDKAVECWGITTMVFENLQLYQNDTYTASYGVWLNGTSSVIRNVRVRSAKVRVTAGNSSYTAFYAAGANVETASCTVDDVDWNDFDHPGQTRITGWTSGSGGASSSKETLVVHRSAALSVVTTDTNIVFDVIDQATNAANYSTASGQYTAPHNGVYSVEAHVMVNSATAGSSFTMYVYDVTGAAVLAEVIRATNGIASESFSISTSVYIPSGHSVVLRCINSAGTVALNVSNGSLTRMSITEQ